MSSAPAPAAPTKTRTHGLERPYDVHQYVSWVAFAVLLAAFFGLHTPVRSNTPLGIALNPFTSTGENGDIERHHAELCTIRLHS